ncbi:MAG: TRAP transporter small permease [Gammaproteobacteria bacterium]|nr:TRAP transporter small permease [Gammaproteobacteria bacterium]
MARAGVSQLATRLSTGLAVLALFIMMGMTFLDVLFRSIMNQPIEAATELTRILMAVIVFSILPLVSAQGKHITVDLLDQFLPAMLRRSLDGVLTVACGLMLLWPAERCIVLANRARDYGDVTEYLAIPTFYLSWFITISVFITAIALVLRGVWMLWRCLKGLPEQQLPTATGQSADTITHD